MRGICSLLISASSCFGWVTTVPDVVKEITRTISLPGNGHVSLETYKGKILVTTWDRQEIEIVARVEADGSAAESVRATDVRIGSRTAPYRSGPITAGPAPFRLPIHKRRPGTCPS